MGEMIYKCSTKNMKGCVESMLKWIEHAEDIGEIQGFRADAYLRDVSTGWYLDIDGEKCDLDKAIEVLLDKAMFNEDSLNENPALLQKYENKIPERKELLDDALSAWRDDWDLSETKKYLELFKQLEE